MNEKSKNNLIPFTKETAKENGSKGGKASVESRRRKKKMKQAMDMILSLPAKGQYRQFLENIGIDDEDYLDNQALMLAVAFQQAMKGNVKAMYFIEDITGSQAMNELERAKIKLERDKLKLAKEKLEFEKAKNADYTDDDEYEDDNFIEALNSNAFDDWQDGDDFKDDKEKS